MRSKVFLFVALVLGFAANAQAAKLIVMAVNTTAIGGAKVFTVGLQVNAADVTLPGVGSNPVLGVTGLNFGTAAGNGPVQAGNPNNKQDVQTIQGGKIDDAAFANQVAPGLVSGPPQPGDLGSSGVTQLYKDSWWYASSTGTLVGVNNSSGNSGVITTNNAGDGSGVYTIGPTGNVGSTGYLWTPQASGVTGGGTTLDVMGFTGLYGVFNANFLDAAPLATIITNNGGFINVPIAQIVATTNVTIQSAFNGGFGSYFAIGQKTFDWSGAAGGTDTPTTLNFTTGTIQFGAVPEPSTFLLAGMGAVGLVFAWKRRK